MSQISLRTATLLVVASMVGTGIFTTTGLLARDLSSGWLILLTWLIGGGLALCGGLAYAELCARYPRNGGEYWLLGRVYHPALGFIAGIVSIFVGFAATIAVSAAAFAKYAERIFPEIPHVIMALGLVIGVTMVHSLKTARASVFQDLATLGRYVLTAVVAMIAIVLSLGHGTDAWLTGPSTDAFSAPSFAVGLIWVAYAYSGWNAAAYIVDDVRLPHYTVPRALLYGTAMVTVLYALVNVAYLTAVPRAQLAGVIEVAHVVAEALGGPWAGKLISIVIAFGLVSTAGAYTMVGVRIYHVMAADYPKLRWMAPLPFKGHASMRALWIQAGLASLLLVSASFETLLTYVGFMLSVFSALAVFGVFVARRANPSVIPSYLTWGYPFTPIVFLAFNLWMVVYAAIEKPLVAGAGVAILIAGALLYRAVAPRPGSETSPTHKSI
ncbi:MAG: amino acid permease [Myxococcales bacterium]|nr:amino acid permease [Myxococcales bacterium]MCB9707454.1 amino acid permease [Myxococcales bacterium]